MLLPNKTSADEGLKPACTFRPTFQFAYGGSDSNAFTTDNSRAVTAQGSVRDLVKRIGIDKRKSTEDYSKSELRSQYTLHDKENK